MSLIGLDLMGSDLGPRVIIKGVKEHLEKNPQEANRILVYLTKDVEEISRQELSLLPKENFIICNSFIHPEDGEMVFRQKPNATFVKGVQDLSSGRIETIISTCSTKSLVATSGVLLKKMSFKSKIALATFLNRSDGKDFFLLDIGARVSYNSQDFISLANYGIEIMKRMRNKPTPSIRLINIGQEPGKGDALHIEADKLLREKFPDNYKGNMDPYMLITHRDDIIITDGFSGNIMAKSFEGGIELMGNEIKALVKKNFINKLAVLTIKKDLKEAFFKYDYRSRGAAYLFGFEKLVLKAHGRSDEVAISHALSTARELIEKKVIENLTKVVREG